MKNLILSFQALSKKIEHQINFQLQNNFQILVNIS